MKPHCEGLRRSASLCTRGERGDPTWAEGRQQPGRRHTRRKCLVMTERVGGEDNLDTSQAARCHPTSLCGKAHWFP